MAADPALRRLALSTLLAAFPGHTPPAWATRLVEQGLAGHTLYGYNIARPDQLRALTRRLREARADVLLATDEEGGDVTRLAHHTGSPYPGNAALGAVGDVTLTRRVYQAIGAELADVGINLDLAPTVDVNTVDDNPVIGTRSFGADVAQVSAHATAAVVGLQRSGVAACAKHFPGHGATDTDSHHELPLVDVSLDTLHARELPPFASVVAADTRAIMTGHIRVPSLTGADPATFSRRALVDLLRGEFGFTGAVLTDALEMQASAATAGGVPAAAVRSLAAGADLLCIGAQVDEELVEATAAQIAGAVRDGRLAAGRVEQAAARTAALAAWTLGHLRDEVDPDLGYGAARRAVRVEGSVEGFAAPLVVQIRAESNLAEGSVPWGLAAHLRGGIGQLSVDAVDTTVDALLSTAADRPVVLVGRHIHRAPAARALVEALAKVHPVVVVEMGWPSSWRPAGARAVLITYGASHANGRAAADALGLAPAQRPSVDP